MNFKDKTIVEYVNALSEKSSVPGGGSVLALVNELSAGLLLMVARFTLNKKGYEEHNERMEEIIEVLEEIKGEVHDIIDDDAIVFSNLMKAFSSKNEEEISAASIEAAIVPQSLYYEAQKLICIANELILKGNKNVVSDAQIALSLSTSTLQGCLHHVEINIDQIKEEMIKNRFIAFLKEEK